MAEGPNAVYDLGAHWPSERTNTEQLCLGVATRRRLRLWRTGWLYAMPITFPQPLR